VSGNTDYLVVGEDPGSKLDRARELGIPELDEAGLRELSGSHARIRYLIHPRTTTRTSDPWQPHETSRSPPTSILALRRALQRRWAETAAAALQEAGHAAGDALFDRLGRTTRTAGATPVRPFWERLAGLFRELGWGTVRAPGAPPRRGRLVAPTGSRWSPASRPAAPSPPASWPTSSAAWPAGRGRAPGPLRRPPAGCARFLFGSPQVLDRALFRAPGREDLEAPGSASSADGPRSWVDYGERRIGLALSDPTATIAIPCPPSSAGRASAPRWRPSPGSEENDVEEIVVGLPLTPRGRGERLDPGGPRLRRRAGRAHRLPRIVPGRTDDLRPGGTGRAFPGTVQRDSARRRSGSMPRRPFSSSRHIWIRGA
jgi:hypothetical protein